MQEKTQTWGKSDWVENNDVDFGTDGSENNWIVYAEGIYVGYKYYETRYEDTVLKAGNADSTKGSSTGMHGTMRMGELYTDFPIQPLAEADQVKILRETDSLCGP